VVKLLYLAKLREDLGVSAEEIPLPEGVATVTALRAHLAARGRPWSSALAGERSIRVAVNQEMANGGTPVAPGDEVAFFPPVTGG
jgi:molybdopterin synthase sulfur carrier subunit